MFRGFLTRSIRQASNKSHLAGVTPKLHENRGDSKDLGGQIVVCNMSQNI